MPEIKQVQEHFADNADWAMLTVSLDGQDTDQRLLDLIRDEHITYPVLHAGGQDGWNDGNFGWTITGVPSAYIIDPQGNIFADVYPEAGLIEDFDWLIAQDGPVPPIGMDVSSNLEDNEVTLTIQLTSPRHEPLDVKIQGAKYKMVYNPERDTEGTGEPNDYEVTDISEDLGLDFTAEFGMFGDASEQLTIPVDADAKFYSFSVSVDVPGMEHLHDGEGFAVSKYIYVNMEQKEDAESE